MPGDEAAERERASDDSRKLIAQIAAFLTDRQLDATPDNYASAYRLLAGPDGALADPSPEASLPHVEDFETVMRTMRFETESFWRDLEASAAAMRDLTAATPGGAMRITSAMIERVRSVEARLEDATHEASELRAKLEEARDNARRDPLTGLPNRRAFEETYDGYAGLPACVAMCDVDRFKSINDRFGHAVGDRVLQAIADVLALSCPGHHVARYGGEEFAVLFVECQIDQARRALDHARTTVASKRGWLRDNDEPIGKITFSAGLTVALPGERRADVIRRADVLLYEAKRAGRNCLRIG